LYNQKVFQKKWFEGENMAICMHGDEAQYCAACRREAKILANKAYELGKQGNPKVSPYVPNEFLFSYLAGQIFVAFDHGLRDAELASKSPFKKAVL
jgi:hypothetical protein